MRSLTRSATVQLIELHALDFLVILCRNQFANGLMSRLVNVTPCCEL